MTRVYQQAVPEFFLLSEANGTRSRDTVYVKQAAGAYYPPGTILVKEEIAGEQQLEFVPVTASVAAYTNPLMLVITSQGVDASVAGARAFVIARDAEVKASVVPGFAGDQSLVDRITDGLYQLGIIVR